LLLRSIEAKPWRFIFESNLPKDMPDAGCFEGAARGGPNFGWATGIRG